MTDKNFSKLKDEYSEFSDKLKIEVVSNRERPRVMLILQLLDEFQNNHPNRSLAETYRTNKGTASIPNPSWIEKINDLDKLAKEVESQRDKLLDKERSIMRIERKGHIMATCFRILTTAGIGLTIMGIYALAHYLEIPMPLMRLPMPG